MQIRLKYARRDAKYIVYIYIYISIKFVVSDFSRCSLDLDS